MPLHLFKNESPIFNKIDVNHVILKLITTADGFRALSFQATVNNMDTSSYFSSTGYFLSTEPVLCMIKQSLIL